MALKYRSPPDSALGGPDQSNWKPPIVGPEMDRNGGGAKKFSGAAMILGIPKETFPGERRVAIVPTLAKNYQKYF